MANKNSITERLTRVEEGIKHILDQINPKTEMWNNTSNDVKWLKKFFWVIFIALCGLLAKAVVMG